MLDKSWELLPQLYKGVRPSDGANVLENCYGFSRHPVPFSVCLSVPMASERKSQSSGSWFEGRHL